MPDSEDEAFTPVSKRALAIMIGAALVGATVITLLFILPAQFQLDPTGFGKATGLVKLGAAQTEVVTAAAPASAAHFSPTPYRSDTFTILQPKSGDPGYEMEYKVRMKAGDTIVYSWTSDADPKNGDFYFDFHGETPAVGDQKAKVVEYRDLTAVQSYGALTAPIDGIHGWYFLNDSLKVATIRLKISGYYELIPPGEYGNEAKILPDR